MTSIGFVPATCRMRATTRGITSTGCGTCFTAMRLSCVATGQAGRPPAGPGKMPDFHRNDAAHLKSQEKLRLLLVSIVPPKNDCGVRIVMHRMLVERSPFELHVASSADFADDLLVHTPLRLPYLIHR